MVPVAGVGVLGTQQTGHLPPPPGLWHTQSPSRDLHPALGSKGLCQSLFPPPC